MNEERGFDLDYFKQLTSEKAIIDDKTRRRAWKPKVPGSRNEGLDLKNYNRIAVDILNPIDIKMLHAQIVAKGEKVKGEPGGQGSEQKREVKRKPPRKRGGFAKRF